MANPLISICLPNLNYRQFLEPRMVSILEQTVSDWELIVCDSYSDDGAWEYLQTFRDDPRVRLYQVPREGLYAGWNECLRRARGEYVYIATSDDTMYPTCLERLVTPLEAHPEIHLAVCNFDVIDDQGEVLDVPLTMPRVFLGDWLHRDSIRNGLTEFLIMAASGTMWQTMTSVLFRRSLLDRTGLFRTDLGSCADEEWVLRAALASDVIYVADRLATWRRHATQATGNWRSKRQFLYWSYCALRAVLEDLTAGIPSEWRARPALMAAIFEARKRDLWGSFEITRSDLRRNPRRFWADLRDAISMSPDYLRYQCSVGFTHYEGRKPSVVENIEHLIGIAGTPWPPQPLATAMQSGPAAGCLR